LRYLFVIAHQGKIKRLEDNRPHPLEVDENRLVLFAGNSAHALS